MSFNNRKLKDGARFKKAVGKWSANVSHMPR
jgi:hypothetical protein